MVKQTISSVYLVKVSEDKLVPNEEVLLFKDEKYSPSVVLNQQTKSIFVKVQGTLKRYRLMKEFPNFDCTPLHVYPLEKFHRFYINDEGSKLAALDLNGAISLYEIGENSLRTLGGYGLAESINKSFRSRVSDRKCSKNSNGELKNPFKDEISTENSPEKTNSSCNRNMTLDKSLDASTTAIFESIKNCSFLNQNILLMVDESDSLMFYDFKKKTSLQSKIHFLGDLAKNFTHIDGLVTKQEEDTIYYISYASQKQHNENSNECKIQLVSLFKLEGTKSVNNIKVETLF